MRMKNKFKGRRLLRSAASTFCQPALFLSLIRTVTVTGALCQPAGISASSAYSASGCGVSVVSGGAGTGSCVSGPCSAGGVSGVSSGVAGSSASMISGVLSGA